MQEIRITERKFLKMIQDLIDEELEAAQTMEAEIPEELKKNPFGQLTDLSKIGYIVNHRSHQDSVGKAQIILEQYKVYKEKGYGMIYILTDNGPGFRLKFQVERREGYLKEMKKKINHTFG